MRLRPALLARVAGLALVAGCASPSATPSATSSGRATVSDRAAAAGLSDAQAAALTRIGVPVAVPGRLPAGWRVAGVDAPEVEYPEYTVRYAGPGGTCFAVTGATEGLGDRFLLAPSRQRDIDAPTLATHGPIPLGWSDDAGNEDWGGRRATTEWFGTDGVAYAVDSPAGDGCERADIDTLADVVGSLHMLDPRDDGPTGVWAFADLTGGAGPTPEAAARSAAGPDEENGRTTVEVLNRRERYAVVLVTRTGLADDSVRDERLRVTTVHERRAWTVVDAVRQVRCQPGRGHTDWSADACL